MLDPLPKDEDKEFVRCPVDGCNERLEKDDHRGYAIYYCDIHGEVEPEDIDQEEI